MKKYSVIIPIYNMEKYLAEALRTVSQQSYTEFEAILVDDCSTDNSRKIAQEWVDKDTRFSLVCQEKNQGVSAARNVGLKRASGEYVLFMDPDDLWDEKLLEEVDEALSSEPDLLIFGFKEEYFDEKGKESLVKEIVPNNFSHDMNQSMALKEIMTLESHTLLGYPWNKAYKRSLLVENKICFPEGQSFAEDIMFNVDVLEISSTINGIDKALYHYRNIQKKRLTSGIVLDYWTMQKRRVERLLELIDKRNISNDQGVLVYANEIMASVYFRSFMSMIMRKLDSGEKKTAILENCEAEAVTELFNCMATGFIPKGKVEKLLYVPLSKKDFATAMRRAKEVDFAKKNLGGVYNRLKTRR